MDKTLLINKGLHPTDPQIAYVDGFELNIGERATLVRSEGQRAHGTVMALDDDELIALYGESSVADYVPENIVVTTSEQYSLEVTVYNLPKEKLVGRNKEYAQQLANAAAEIGLPNDYIEKIEWFSK